MSLHVMILANPFGLGPTAMALRAIAPLQKHFKDITVTFASLSTSFTNAFVPATVRHIECNERDTAEIAKVLRRERPDFTICSLNRFAIIASKEVGIPSIAMDSLWWFWESIPYEYKEATKYLCLQFPGDLNRLKLMTNHALIPHFIPESLPQKTARHGIVVHLGGVFSPFNNEVSSTLITSLSGLFKYICRENQLTILAPIKIIEMFKDLLPPGTNPTYASLTPSEAFLAFSKAEAVLTTAGLGSILDLLASKTPTIFLPPLNLSHQRNLEAILTPLSDTKYSSWKDILKEPEFDKLIYTTEQNYIRSLHMTLQNCDEQRIEAQLIDLYRKGASFPVNGTSFITNSVGVSYGSEIVDVVNSILNR